jgi:hypothetical protein
MRCLMMISTLTKERENDMTDKLQSAVTNVTRWAGCSSLLDALYAIDDELQIEAEPDVPDDVVRDFRFICRSMRPLFEAPDDTPSLDAPWWESR